MSKGKEVSRHVGRKESVIKIITLPPILGQISPDLSVYQNPISGSYINSFRHHRAPWLADLQFPQGFMALQSTLPSQSLTTEGLTHPQKGNSLSLSLFLHLIIGLGSSFILIGDSLVPASMLIGFSGVPGMGTGGGDGDGRGGRMGNGLGEACRACPLWFF